MADPYPELEIGVGRESGGRYRVELRFSDPKSQALPAPATGLSELNLDDLTQLRLEPDSYGKALAHQLFAGGDSEAMYQRAKAVAEDQEVPLRIRLLVKSSA